MSDEAQIKSVALFFFFTLLDESLAHQATEQAFHKLKRNSQKRMSDSLQGASQLVKITSLIWDKFSKLKYRPRSQHSFEGTWELPSESDIGLWKEYAKTADASEMQAIVWSLILKLTDQQIADGLGVTEGTIRHRVGRGLRDMGRLRT